MGILDQLRNWTPDKLDGRSDFDDLPPAVYRPRQAREMQRVVKGATDLRDAMPQATIPSAFAGQVVTDPDLQRRGTRRFADQVGQPSEKQRALIIKLVDELIALDAAKGQQAAEYTVRMTQEAAWMNRAANGKTRASNWIDTLITAVRHSRTNSAPATAPAAPAKPQFDAYDDVTDGNYAIVRAGKTHFYRITRKAGKGQYAGRTFINIQERASEELFPVRGPWPQRRAILDSIRTAGVDAAHLLYSERLTRCWHCNILLTDDSTNPYRPYGLGPVCGPNVMG